MTTYLKRYTSLIFEVLILSAALLFANGKRVQAQSYKVATSYKVVKVEGKTYYQHKVAKGNTLFNLAEAYNVSKSDIIKSNPELNSQNIQLNQTLLIPISGGKTSRGATIYHIVKEGETLYSIAKAYNTSVADIKQLNSISGDKLGVGRYIKVSQRRQQPEYQTTVSSNSKKVFHIIRPKENLYSISKQWGVSVKDLRLYNKLKTHHIKAFDTLWIPLGTQSFPYSIKEKPFIMHYVQVGETLYSIARYYAISVEDLKTYNHIKNNKIRRGQSLKIPRKANDKHYIEHIVEKRREKVSSIARQYVVPLEKLKALNPNLGHKVVQGTIVRIPLPYIESDLHHASPAVVQHQEEGTFSIEPAEEPEEADTDPVNAYEGDCLPMSHQERSYTIAVLLPLELAKLNTDNLYDTLNAYNNRKTAPYKFMEFYEGVLLAARQLAAQGMDFQLKVVDIPKNATDIDKRLSQAHIQNSDLVISLLYTNEFKAIEQYTKRKRIPLVNAVSKRRQILNNNSYVYKVQANEQALYTTAVDYLKVKHKQSNIIIVRNNAYELSRDYKKLNALLQKDMPKEINIANSDIISKYNVIEAQMAEEAELNQEKRNDECSRVWQLFREQHPDFVIHRIQANAAKITTFTQRIPTIIYDESNLVKLLKAINPFSKNIIIGLSQEEVFAIELLTKLNHVNKYLDIEILGLPHWDEFKKLDADYTQNLNLQILSDTYIDYNKPIVQNFVHQFRSAFKTEPLPQRYAFLGYDISLYFMTAFKHFGSRFNDCLPSLQIPLLERSFRFKKTALGGHENTHWQVLKQQNYIYKVVY